MRRLLACSTWSGRPLVHSSVQAKLFCGTSVGLLENLLQWADLRALESDRLYDIELHWNFVLGLSNSCAERDL